MVREECSGGLGIKSNHAKRVYPYHVESRLSKPVADSAVIERLAEACRQDIHEFWPDEVSLLDTHIVDTTRIHGPRQLTEIYLLALAVQHDGRLVTFDSGIPLTAVRRATPQKLLIL